MARTTAKQVLDRVDALLPNGYERTEKLRWLAQAEGFVQRELCGETGELPELAESTELTAELPFDELYRYYVESQIHYSGLSRPHGYAARRRGGTAPVLRGGRRRCIFRS